MGRRREKPQGSFASTNGSEVKGPDAKGPAVLK